MKKTEKGFALPEALLMIGACLVCIMMVLSLSRLYSNIPVYSSEEDMNELWNNIARKTVYRKEEPFVDIVY